MTDDRRGTGPTQADDVADHLQRAFRSGPLPAAPDTLLDALERIPDAPVRVRRRAGGGRAGAWGALGIAATLVLGGALAVSVGQRGTVPAPTLTAPTASVLPAASAVARTVLEYAPAWTATHPANEADLDAIAVLLSSRLQSIGVRGHVVTTADTGNVRVDLPTTAVEGAREVLGVTGDLSFVPVGAEVVPTGQPLDPSHSSQLFGREGLRSASVESGQGGERTVVMKLERAAARTFSDWTQAHVGEYFAIAVDGLVLVAPVISTEIPGGEVEISRGDPGGWDGEEAAQIVAILNHGPLPVPIEEVSSQTPVPSASAASVRP